MVNETARKFGYPETLIKQYDHWLVLLRPAQVTLGALVLICKDPAKTFSGISPPAFAELAGVTRDIETALHTFRGFDKINYLMLMMLDPDVHFHVLPRYSKTQTFAGQDFPDPGWPAAPNLAKPVTPEPEILHDLRQSLIELWQKL